jgi:hypothetical protein
VTGGTGRFAGISGRISVSGRLDDRTRAVTITLRGTVTL